MPHCLFTSPLPSLFTSMSPHHCITTSLPPCLSTPVSLYLPASLPSFLSSSMPLYLPVSLPACIVSTLPVCSVTGDRWEIVLMASRLLSSSSADSVSRSNYAEKQISQK